MPPQRPTLPQPTAFVDDEAAQRREELPQSVTDECEVESVFRHPEALALFSKAPFLRWIPLFGESAEGYGVAPTLSLGMSYLLSKGLADYLLRGSTYAMMIQRYEIDVMRFQRLAPITSMGWSLKALSAMMCDAFAFLGYTKRWYLCLSCFLGAVFSLVYGFLPARKSSANIATPLIFLSCFGKANVDILSEGHYSRMIRRNPKPGPALISWVWWFIMLGSLISSSITGPLADAHMPHISVFISTALLFVTGFVFVFNWFGELTNRAARAEDTLYLHEELRRVRQAAVAQTGVVVSDSSGGFDKAKQADVEDAQVQSSDAALQEATKAKDRLVIPEPVPCCCGVFEFNEEVVFRNWRVFVYSLVMTVAVLANAVTNMFAPTYILLITAVSISVVCCGTSLWALPPVIAKANIFGYLSSALSIGIGVAVRGFYQAGPDCVADGPHFSYLFYETISSLIGGVAGLVGVTTFKYILSKRTYHFAIITTTLLQIAATVFDFMIVLRWTSRLGINDHYVYVFGSAIVGELISMLGWMPMVILISRLCPRGSESVVYALMAGFSNLGQSTASSLGAILMEYQWPVVSKVPCDYSNLPKLLIVATATPILIIPLCLLLLPSAKMCDDIDVSGDATKKVLRAEERGSEHEHFELTH